MLNSNHRFLRFSIFVALATLATISTANCQQPESKKLEWAREWLRTFYPELNAHRYVMTATTYQPFDGPERPMSPIKLQVGDFAPGTVLGAATVVNGVVIPRQPKQFINASLTFDSSGHLSAFYCEGTAVGKQEEYERFKQTVDSHGEWTEAQAISALMEAGASYGPTEREKILRLIPVDQLEKLLGSTTVTSSEFESMSDVQLPRLALFRWRITVSVSFPDRSVGSYRMYFEPFKGALTGMESVAR